MNVDENVEKESEKEKERNRKSLLLHALLLVTRLSDCNDVTGVQRQSLFSPRREEYVAVDGGKVDSSRYLLFRKLLPVFYKPDECGLDFSGVPQPLASLVLSLQVWSSSLSSSSLLLSFSLASPSSPSLPRLLLTDTKLLQDYADPTSLPLFSCATTARS